MKCDKCNHNLPDDSEFCQYCGNKIQIAVSESKTIADEASSTLDEIVVGVASTSDNAMYEDILNNPVEAKTTATEKEKEAKNQSQPDNESNEEIAPALEKLIYTRALPSFDGNDSVEKTLKGRNNKKIKIRYCSRCGSLIDNDSKICTGCKKKYFKIRLKKTSIALIILSLVLAASVVIDFLQYYEIKSLKQRQTLLETKVRFKH